MRVSGNWRERYEYLGLLVVFSEYKEKQRLNMVAGSLIRPKEEKSRRKLPTPSPWGRLMLHKDTAHVKLMLTW